MVKDITPPTVETSTLAVANAYILFNISEGIFTNDDGSGPVQPEDFNVVFNSNHNLNLYKFITLDTHKNANILTDLKHCNYIAYVEKIYSK